MPLGITSKLPGWKLAIKTTRLIWNHRAKSLGSKSSNSGARAVKVRFRMVSLTAGFLMMVMFLWERNGLWFSVGGHAIFMLNMAKMREGLVTHLCNFDA